MKATGSLSLLTLALSGPASAFIGYGISMYNPNCAFACRSIFASAPLECTPHDHAFVGHSHGASPTSATCYAGDTPFLTTVANCINATCTDIEPWRLEKYWAEKMTRDAAVPPKWTLQETLAHLADMQPPTRLLGPHDELNFTAAFSRDMWDRTRLTLNTFEYAEMMNSRTGIILLAVGFATPIFVSSLGYLPFMSRLQDTLNPRLAWPSLIGTYHVRALPFSIGIAPTLGQTWYIALMTVLAIILTGVGHKSTQPNAWFTSSWRETMNYISNRTAVHAFCLAPLVVLFAGRNNILLYLTNWPHATFILLHRWVARLFGLQVLVHALLELAIYRQNHSLAAEQSHPYWLWGVGGVVVYLVLVATSVLPARRKSYELFLVTHIVLAALMLVAAWYHVRLMHGGANWGYQYWLYATFAVWAADRALRVLRVLKNGVHRARVRLVADGIVRVDVPGVRWDAQPGKHAYVFFPGLNRARPWENHPFSVVPTALLGGGVADVGGDVDGVDTDLSDTDTETSPASSPTQHTRPELVVDDVDIEKQTHILDVSKSALDTKNPATTTMTTTTALPPRTPSRAPPATGITLFIRPGTGLTARLLASPSPSSPSPPTSLPLLTLLDGPYSTPSLTPTLAPSPPILRAHRLILIAGGVGITGVLPLLHAHPNAALHWGVKEAARGLVGEVSGALGLARARAQARAGAARSRRAGEGGGEDVQGEVEVYVGARMAVRGLLEREAEAAWGRVGVVVCGPGPLCDEVRSEVGRCAREARGGTAWELEVEAFSW